MARVGIGERSVKKVFGLGKKKEEQVPIVYDVRQEELKEYVSIDNIKAHLVDTLEENRRLREEIEDYHNRYYKEQRAEQKKTEVALIEADEWKKRAKEKDETISKLKKDISERDSKIEELTREMNSMKVDVEMKKIMAAKEEAAGVEVAEEKEMRGKNPKKKSSATCTNSTT